MSVKQGLLALLAESPKYGAQLRSEFEERTGGTWPLNVGQVYTTLARLERDRLVEPVGPPDSEGRITYRLTERGAVEARRWWSTPVDRDTTPRDELAIKLALAVTVPGVDVQAVAQAQRTATLQHLHDLTRLKQRALAAGARSGDDADRPRDLAWLLVLENLVFAAEAEVRWLDHVEARLARAAARTRPPSTPDGSAAAPRAGGIPAQTASTSEATR